MSKQFSRRSFVQLSAGAAVTLVPGLALAQQTPPVAGGQQNTGPVEAPFERDYTAPEFKPAWKKQQLNRLQVQDFVIYAHSDLDMVKKLLDKEPKLIAATMDWGGGDWESGLNGASHMGRRDIVGYLLEKGARIDIFCAAMLGQLEAVKAFLTLQPLLIDAKGPHGISLHMHAKRGGAESVKVYDYLQSIKPVG